MAARARRLASFATSRDSLACLAAAAAFRGVSSGVRRLQRVRSRGFERRRDDRDAFLRGVRRLTRVRRRCTRGDGGVFASPDVRLGPFRASSRRHERRARLRLERGQLFGDGVHRVRHGGLHASEARGVTRLRVARRVVQHGERGAKRRRGF